ncbi:MAG: 1,3-beta-galactosyl-N-acetylhexosamine phosphorylase [Clostridium sp.]|nr:1,3-beta-galactosyl-N-acetylhexosamine phosphorylase [Clostridium sp.]
MEKQRGGFTLPGESGYEELTLKLAEKWGADVIRDSDGTELSEDIIHAGYGIYSTLCIIRDHNEWAKENRDKLQQTFLCTEPVTAVSTDSQGLTIALMDDFFTEQFEINDCPASMKYWQVYDRTSNTLLPTAGWTYDKAQGTVTIHNVTPWHKYTVSFLAYRIWEEISMYNHTTNNWDKEHLMQIDPRYPETREYLTGWLKKWCESHPDTTVVRFTSLFYNFVWIWGSHEECRSLFTDWGSYDFTVSERALDEFAEQYGYSMTAEDFINQGKRHVTHMPGDAHKSDWMKFINDFVISFGKQLVDIVHSYGKKAYVFYDDSWVGLEPYNGRFGEFGFDGLIKCVFSGYEARLCAGVDVPVHELRLHPYLFPVGLGGAPTFMEGGDPTTEAKRYWNHIRRALLRSPVDRIGLGGYLHLTEGFPDFCDYIEQLTQEFHMIQDFHKKGAPYCIKTKVAVLHSWGALRSWTLSGHFHETYQHDLIHINEALAGLPVEVSFLFFEDVKAGRLNGIDVVINAGYAGSAWSGGDAWKDDKLIEVLTEWVYRGGTFIGVNEPSATTGYDTYFRMAHVLGVDEDTGERICHGKWLFDASDAQGLVPDGAALVAKPNRYLTDGKAKVLMAQDTTPVLSVHDFGKGKGIYLSSFQFTDANTRLLYQLIRYAGGEKPAGMYMTDNCYTECAYYPESKTLVVINNSEEVQTTRVETHAGVKELTLDAFATVFINL